MSPPHTSSGCGPIRPAGGALRRGERLLCRRWRNAPHILSNPINYTDPSGKEPILPILVCLGLVVADGPAPIGDAVCAALLAGTAGVATFGLTIATNPPTQYTSSQYNNFTLEQPNFPPLIFPLPERQLPRPLIFPLPQPQQNKPLIFPLPVEGQIPCNTSPFPLRSGLNLPPYTPPFPLKNDLNLPPFYLANKEWDVSKPLVYGPSARGKFAKFAQRIGGETLTDLENPNALPMDALSVAVLLKAVVTGRQVIFDLTNMKNIEGPLCHNE